VTTHYTTRHDSMNDAGAGAPAEFPLLHGSVARIAAVNSIGIDHEAASSGMLRTIYLLRHLQRRRIITALRKVIMHWVTGASLRETIAGGRRKRWHGGGGTQTFAPDLRLAIWPRPLRATYTGDNLRARMKYVVGTSGGVFEGAGAFLDAVPVMVDSVKMLD
jgi:hypothetical protein